MSLLRIKEALQFTWIEATQMEENVCKHSVSSDKSKATNSLIYISMHLYSSTEKPKQEINDLCPIFHFLCNTAV